MKEFTVSGFAAFCGELVMKMPRADHVALEKAAMIIETEAKRVLGTYDYDWPELAQSTQDERTYLGFEPNEPGLRTGEMRDSIKHEVGYKEADIGSDLDKAIWFEMGTWKQPPRPFLAGAAIHKEREVVDILGQEIVGFISTGIVDPHPFAVPVSMRVLGGE